MTSDRATSAAARLPADLPGRDTARTLAGLIHVLDRADGVPGPKRPIRHRSAAAARAGTGRGVPLRSVRPAPPARPAPAPLRVVVDDPAPTDWTASEAPVPQGRRASLVRRMALWGAGPQGEYLAWRPAVRPVRTAARPVVRTPDGATAGPVRRHGLLRRAALWGAGTDGQYLAWGGPSRPGAKPAGDRPVVLREMPSTPTIAFPPNSTPQIQLSAPSPARELSHRRPAPAGPRWTPPVPRGAVAVPGIRPSGPPERSRATGWPPQVTGSGVPTGLAQARGDPLSSPARGSPGPARRSRSPNSSRSSFP
jgi:hypothetical protein